MSAAILGGGLSGLSTAYYLRKLCPQYAITLVEASHRVGGWIKTVKVQDDIFFEQGPRTIRPAGNAGANTLALLDELGLTSKIVPILKSEPATKNRMIYVNGRLHSLPSSLLGLFKRQDPFSKPLISYIAREIFVRKKSVTDEPIYDFAQRRFGTEFADYLVSAMICGICAGNSKEISVNFLMKTPFDYEQTHGSVTKGLLRNLFKAKPKTPTKVKRPASMTMAQNWSAYSLQDGIETLPKALESAIKDTVTFELNSKCVDLEMFPRRALLQLESGKQIQSNFVFSSIPSEKLADLVQTQYPDLSESLRKIKSVTVAVVNLHYNKKFKLKEGFGFLVPPKEGLPILGVTYDSCCFPKGDNTIFTVMMGGPWFEQHFGKNPDEAVFLKTAKEQLERILKIQEEPANFKVSILEKCIPQYVVGHNENLRKIDQLIDLHKLPLGLCGASYQGVGINDVIMSAKTAVEGV